MTRPTTSKHPAKKVKKALPAKRRPAAKKKASPKKTKRAARAAPMFDHAATQQVPVAEVLVDIEETMVLDQLTELPED